MAFLETVKHELARKVQHGFTSHSPITLRTISMQNAQMQAYVIEIWAFALAIKDMKAQLASV
jgi:hypothetical protein